MTPSVATRRGFTLVEMLVSITIVVILLTVLFSVSAGITNIWKSSAGKVSSFQNARYAFSTLSETLGRATLNTYSDYVTVSNGVTTFRNTTNASSFVPTKFARASELHFLCGPTTDIAKATETSSGGYALGTTTTDRSITPGHAVFFQAPLGTTDQSALTGLSRLLNSVAFYVQYTQPTKNLVPEWLSGLTSATNYRFELVQYVESGENLQIYNSTSNVQYSLDWLSFAKLQLPSAATSAPPRTRVLAEDVLVLVLRPRLPPEDEVKIAATIGETYDISTQGGSVLCPNYHYDSRAWGSGYPAALRVQAGPYAANRIPLMQNQLPPIIDVAMVCADSQSLAHFDARGSTPPSALQVPAGLFANSANLEADLNTYATQLVNAHVRFHILRSAIGIRAAKWSNN